jgi:hypothetical protein
VFALRRRTTLALTPLAAGSSGKAGGSGLPQIHGRRFPPMPDTPPIQRFARTLVAPFVATQDIAEFLT